MSAALAWFFGGGWRTLFLMAAAAFAMTSIYTLSLHKDYVFVLEQQESSNRLHTAELGQRDTVIDSYKSQEALWTTIADERKAAVDAALIEVARARQAEAAARSEVAASHAAFQEAFDKRTPDCTAALLQLEAMCPALSSY